MYLLEIPLVLLWYSFCPVRKKVDLRRVLCGMLYLKSVYHKEDTRRSLG